MIRLMEVSTSWGQWPVLVNPAHIVAAWPKTYCQTDPATGAITNRNGSALRLVGDGAEESYNWLHVTADLDELLVLCALNRANGTRELPPETDAEELSEAIRRLRTRLHGDAPPRSEYFLPDENGEEVPDPANPAVSPAPFPVPPGDPAA